MTRVDADVRSLLRNMVATMRDAGGSGLAAPQVGVGLAALVAEHADTEANPQAIPQLHCILNPEIVQASGIATGLEGCLSIPHLLAEVVRAESVTVRGLDVRGRPHCIRAHGWVARILQHEVDHLHGVLMTDRAEALYRVVDGNLVRADAGPVAA